MLWACGILLKPLFVKDLRCSAGVFGHPVQDSLVLQEASQPEGLAQLVLRDVQALELFASQVGKSLQRSGDLDNLTPVAQMLIRRVT